MDSVGTGADGAARPGGRNGGRGGLKPARAANGSGAKAHNGEAQNGHHGQGQNGQGRARAAAPIKALEAEVQARRAEARWLHAHYGERLRALIAEVAALTTRAETAERAAEPEPGARQAGLSADAEASIAALSAELETLKAEHERQKTANERYLARIYELKRALQTGEGSRP